MILAHAFTLSTEVVMLKKILLMLILSVSIQPIFAQDAEEDPIAQVQTLVQQGENELNALLLQKRKGQKLKLESFVSPLSLLSKARRTMIDFQLQEENPELQAKIEALLELGSNQDEVKDRVKVLRKALVNALQQKDMQAADKALNELFQLDGKNDKLNSYAAQVVNQQMPSP
jgi:hypothetical protein